MNRPFLLFLLVRGLKGVVALVTLPVWFPLLVLVVLIGTVVGQVVEWYSNAVNDFRNFQRRHK